MGNSTDRALIAASLLLVCSIMMLNFVVAADDVYVVK
jgi:hypothetical protein